MRDAMSSTIELLMITILIYNYARGGCVPIRNCGSRTATSGSYDEGYFPYPARVAALNSQVSVENKGKV